MVAGRKMVRVGLLCIALVAVAILSCSACLAEPTFAPARQQIAPPAGDSKLDIKQGTTARYGDTVIGFVNALEPGEASLSLWCEGETLWVSRVTLVKGMIFPAGSHFLRLDEIFPAQDGQRARIALAEASDAGGIQAAQAHHPLLLEGGVLEVGLSRIELDGSIEQGRASAGWWPKLYARSAVNDDQVERATLEPGKTLRFGSKVLRVVRLQPHAGDVLGYVEFEIQS